MPENKQIFAAAAFLFNAEGKVFLAKFTKKFEKKWSIPGGKLDFGETPLEAVIREVKEETNLDIENIRLLEVGSFLAKKDEEMAHVIFIDYTADLPENFEIRLNEEFSEWGFFSRQELEDLDIIPKTKETALKAMRLRNKKLWAEKLASYNLGLIRRTVCLQKSQSNWKDAHEWVKSQIQETLGNKYPMESVGSTVLPKVLAKPILDIVLLFKDGKDFEKEISKLEDLGFTYKGDGIAHVQGTAPSKDRHFFAFYDESEKIDYVHIHGVIEGSTEHLALVNFREVLLKNPSLVEKYKNLKIDLKHKNLQRREYTLAKSEFVRSVIAVASLGDVSAYKKKN